jgi:gluconate kinase
LRRIAELSETARYIIVDFKRVHLAHTSACKLILRLAHSMREGDTELLFAEIANDGLGRRRRRREGHLLRALGRAAHELAAAYPNIMVTILSNLKRDFSERLRHANEAIRSLE